MALNNKFKHFDDELLVQHPDLKVFLKPNDHYPELKLIMKNRSFKLPAGSLNTKIIINHGEIVERVFKTPLGQVVSLFSNPSNVIIDQVA
tara:strand:+ start:95 stop:364 length:270 start_codon:yes stop_codon:yes gene_type:complete